MTIKEAGAIEISKYREYVIPPLILEECHVCHKSEELRAGACFQCQSLCETDLKKVWLKTDVSQCWDYVWSTGWIIARGLLKHQNG